MKKYKIILIHVFTWVFYIGLSTLDYVQKYSISQAEYNFTFIKQYTFYLIFVFLFYFNAYFLFPRYYHLQRKIKYIVYLLLTWVFCYLLFIIHGYFLYLFTGEYQFVTERLGIYLGIYFYFVYFTGFSLGYKLIIESYKTRKLEDELSKAKLALLKYQISPHFLFNTLNNILLLVQRKSDKAPQAVIMLSDLLRNTLIENMDEKISIDYEISYLTNFIELQKLRLEFPDIIMFNVANKSTNAFIYPLLLIPFVENAFKHGKVNSKDIFVSINLEVSNRNLFFKVENSYGDKNKDKMSGIGINNVRDRLDHYYKDKYKLNIFNENGTYSVSLEIEL